MPRTLADLMRVLDLEEIEADLFRGDHAATHLQRTFGGLVLAQAIEAAYRTTPPERAMHSLHATFLRPGRTDAAILYDVETTRDGGTFSSRRVVARQGGATIFTLAASFHQAELGLDHADPQPADVPGPDACPSVGEVMRERIGQFARFWDDWDDLEVRFAGDSSGRDMTGLSHGAHLRVWVRTHGELPADPVLHHAVLAYLSDLTLLSVSTVPHPVLWASPQLQAASLDHAMWFHRPFRADQWLLYDQVSPSASGGLGFSTGRIFQDGLLVASAAQEGLIRVVDDPPATGS